MSVSVSPSEVRGEPIPGMVREPAALPAFVRAKGAIRLGFAASAQGTHLTDLAESGGYRIKFPRTAAVPEAVLINTGGGMAGGDRLAIDVAVGAHAEAVFATQAAEKIYRSDGGETAMATRLELGAAARLDWLPQEAILFRGSRLTRRLDVAMAADAYLLVAESIVFGRLAMGEQLTTGALRDRWRIRRAGRLVFAEELALAGTPAALLDRPALGGGARAIATVLVVAPDAEARLEPLREALAGATCDWGTSAWNGMLVARFADADAQAVRRDVCACLVELRGKPLPRSWL